MAERGDYNPQDLNIGRDDVRSEWRQGTATRQEYDAAIAELNEGGLSDEDRAAAEKRHAQQPGSLASRMDPHGLGAQRAAQDSAHAAINGPIDTGEEVHKFTGEAQDSPEAAVSSGSDGEADRAGGSSISARLSGLDHSDERDDR